MPLIESLLLKLFTERGLTLACAESCTGGAVSHKLVSQSGASAYFKGSIVAYSAQAKEEILGCSGKLLALHGAESAPIAEAMAAGAKKLFKVDYALAITGFVGPSGGSAEAPLGTLFCALASPNKLFSWKKEAEGDRQERIRQGVETLLETLYHHLL